MNYKCKLFPFVREDIFSIQEVTQQASWGITAFDLPKAWQDTQGEDIVIAVLDTGCDLDHPDLVENLLEGYNVVNPRKPPEDGCGHGTHVTGILVAGNNEIGVVGVCPRAKVRPVKVLDDKGNGNLLNVAKGIKWAIAQNVDFISMSLGSPIPVPQVLGAIREAHEKGIVIFVAAGNAGDTKEIFYPAAYKETISIGAIDEGMKRAKFSNTGHNLDFLAPGVDILSTVPDNWYAKLSGTSMAQPFACGVGALLKAYVKKRPELGIVLNKSEDYREWFKKYTTPVTNGNYQDPHFYQGFGIIDPRKFMEGMSH